MEENQFDAEDLEKVKNDESIDIEDLEEKVKTDGPKQIKVSFNSVITLFVIALILGGVFIYKIISRDIKGNIISKDETVNYDESFQKSSNKAQDQANNYRISIINEAISLVKAEIYSNYYTGKETDFDDFADGSLVAERLYFYLADSDIINSADDIKVTVEQTSSETTFSFNFPKAKNLDSTKINKIVIDFWKN